MVQRPWSTGSRMPGPHHLMNTLKVTGNILYRRVCKRRCRHGHNRRHNPQSTRSSKHCSQTAFHCRWPKTNQNGEQRSGIWETERLCSLLCLKPIRHHEKYIQKPWMAGIFICWRQPPLSSSRPLVRWINLTVSEKIQTLISKPHILGALTYTHLFKPSCSREQIRKFWQSVSELAPNINCKE